MAFESCQISNYGKRPTVKDLKDANKALRKMKMHKVKLCFPKLQNLETASIVTFTDATHASLSDGSSQGALIVFLKDSVGVCVPLSWQSKKISRVTKSPLASETLGLGEGADTSFLMATAFHELFPNHAVAPKNGQKWPKIDLKMATILQTNPHS